MLDLYINCQSFGLVHIQVLKVYGRWSNSLHVNVGPT